MNSSFFKSKWGLIAAVVIASLCYFYGNGLQGTFWFLIWIAPVPVLAVAWFNSSKTTFFVALLTGIMGKLSWFGYLSLVASVPFAVIITLLTALVFSASIVFTRALVLRLNTWYGVLVFPTVLTAFEFIQFTFSADGTATSMAYSQLNCLPLIQIASLTGILGITFTVGLIGSAPALAVYFSGVKKQLLAVTVFSGSLIAAVLLFGYLRLTATAEQQTLQVGLLAVAEDLHNNSKVPEPVKDKIVADAYIKQVAELAGQGARVVVLPERAIQIDPQVEKGLLARLGKVAAENHVYLVTGYTNLKGNEKRNSALVIDKQGKAIADYNKVHLVTGFERQFTPGKAIGLFKLGELQSAVAICKDLDFQAYIRQYGERDIRVLFVPAWDFTVDDWLHSRMAILRGVENGFAMVRTARTGSLTISDRYGRVTAESSSAEGHQVKLIGRVSTAGGSTFYSRWGDWLGILSIVLPLFLTAYVFLRSRAIK